MQPVDKIEQPARSLEQYLDALWQQFKELPATHPRRPELARRIRQVEDEIGARQPL